MKRNDVYKILLVLVIVIIAAIYILPRMKVAAKRNQEGFQEDLPSTYELLPEHAGLLSEQYRNNLTVKQVYNSKVRNPTSVLALDDQFTLIIHKLNYRSSASLQQTVHTKVKSVNQTVMISYLVVKDDVLLFKYKAGKAEPASEINVSFGGDSLTSFIKNDSITGYNFLCNKLAVKFSEDSPVDLYIEETARQYDEIPAAVFFIKKDASVYFLFIASKNTSQKLSEHFLRELVTLSNK